jgi:hypothetical protein
MCAHAYDIGFGIRVWNWGLELGFGIRVRNKGLEMGFGILKV